MDTNDPVEAVKVPDPAEPASVRFAQEFRRLRAELVKVIEAPPVQGVPDSDDPGLDHWLSQLHAHDVGDLAELVTRVESTLYELQGPAYAEDPHDDPTLRQFSVVGELQTILLRYRDEESFLDNDTLQVGLKELRDGLQALMAGSQRLNRHLLVELAFSQKMWSRNLSAFESTKETVDRYEDVLQCEGSGGTLSGRMDMHKVWREFVITCSMVLMRHYGFVRPHYIKALLGMKSSEYLKEFQSSAEDKIKGKDDDRRVDRQINSCLQRVRKRALKSARVERWSSLVMMERFAANDVSLNARVARIEGVQFDNKSTSSP